MFVQKSNYNHNTKSEMNSQPRNNKCNILIYKQSNEAEL